MDALRTFLIVILVLLMLRFALRLAAPYIMRYLGRKIEQRFQRQFDAFQNQAAPNAKSGAQVKSNGEQKPRSTKVVGEYIDYEEID